MHGLHWQERDLGAVDLVNFRNDGTTARLDDGAKGAIPLYEALKSMAGANFVNRFYRCGVGNPRYVALEALKLTHSDICALYVAWQVHRFIEQPKHIVEIGAGYGALAAYMRDIYPSARITIVDLPEHHVFIRYYLEQSVGLDGITVTAELPDDADVVVSVRAMMEMPHKEVERYFDWIQSLDSIRWFYIASRYMKWTTLREYPFDDKWRADLSQPFFFQSPIHEFLLRRLTESNPAFSKQLASLPPYKIGSRFAQSWGRVRWCVEAGK